MKLALWQGFEIKTDKGLKEYLGYRPIFCISAETVDDLFTQSILSLPGQPCMLYLFETDDFIAVDKALLYQYLHDDDKDSKNAADYIKETDDKKCVEYIIKEIPEDAFCIDILGYKSVPEAYFNLDDMSPYISNVFNHLHDGFLDNVSGKMRLKATSKTVEVNELSAMAHIYKSVFEFFGMTFTYSAWIGRKYNNPYELSSLLERSLDDWQIRLTEWQLRHEQWDNPSFDHYLDKDVYYKLYDDIYNKRLDLSKCYPIVLGRKLKRNDMCPCGSGKKYKKCCGK